MIVEWAESACVEQDLDEILKHVMIVFLFSSQGVEAVHSVIYFYQRRWRGPINKFIRAPELLTVALTGVLLYLLFEVISRLDKDLLPFL